MRGLLSFKEVPKDGVRYFLSLEVVPTDGCVQGFLGVVEMPSMVCTICKVLKRY